MWLRDGFATVAINGELRERERTVTVTDFTEAEPPIFAGPSSKLNPTLFIRLGTPVSVNIALPPRETKI
jgi:predicted RNA methylase